MLRTLAPDFSAPDQFNKIQTLSSYKGDFIILYFYPKDDTPGCTKEACNFRDGYHELEKIGVIILGVSKDSIESHKKFSEKYSLNFPLLSDPDKKIIKLYNALQTKKLFGKTYESTKRKTFLINKDGVIIKIYENVNPLSHTEEILKDLYEGRTDT